MAGAAGAMLLPETVAWVGVTVTVFVMLTGVDDGAVERIVTTVVSPGAKVGIVTLAVLLEPEATVPAEVEPISDVPEIKVTPDGRVSTTLTEVAVDRPLFVTFTV